MIERVRSAATSALVVALALVACKRSSTANDAGAPAATPAPAATGESTESVTAEPDPFAPDARELPEVEGPRDNLVIDTGTTVTPGTPGVAAPVDPFEASSSAVRASAVGCFAGQPPGEYSATISVVVSPSGRATRVEATASITDDAVVKCLEQTAQRSYPQTNDGRKLSIDVRVKG